MESLLSAQDWRDLQSGDGAQEKSVTRPIDPYMWWLDATGYRSLIRDGQKPLAFSFIAEGDLNGFKNSLKCAPNEDRIKIEDLYSETLLNGKVAKFWTMTFNIEGLSAAEVRYVLRYLVAHHEIQRLQMGFPRGPNQGMEQAEAPKKQTPPLVPSENNRQAVVVGIIDDGCAFAHAALRQPGAVAKTRIAMVWNQSKFDSLFQRTAAGPTWSRPVNFNYGAVMLDGDLNAVMTSPACTDADGSPNELACYQAYWSSPTPFPKPFPNRGMKGRESHGAAVTILAAGNDPVHDEPAATAPIIFVDLPNEQVAISSGRWMPINGLDAIRFIISNARNTYLPAKGKVVLPVVINLSSGSAAGAHDGTAMFERAMDDVLAADDHVAITLAAGNGRLSELHFQCSVPNTQSREIGVFVPHSKRFETYCEVWLPSNDTADILGQLTFTLHSPDGQKTAAIILGTAEFLKRDGVAIAGIHFCKNVVQSVNRAMVLVVIAATNVHPTYPYAAAGCWRVTVENKNQSQNVLIDAWIERDEVVFGARRPQSARFFDDESAGDYFDTWHDSGTRKVQRAGSMSNIATGPRTFAVAAGTGGASGFVSPYSAGPLSTASPAFVATADRSPAQPGILVRGNLRGAWRHMNGTSVAAPQAARWIANEMGNGMTRSAIVANLPAVVARHEPHVGAPVLHDGRMQV